MKKLLTLVLLSTLSLCAMAQLSIWYGGQIVYQRDYSLIDSVTLQFANENPPVNGIENIPAKIEKIMGATASDANLYLRSIGFSKAALTNEPNATNGAQTDAYVNANNDTILCSFPADADKLEIVEVDFHIDNASALDTYRAWSIYTDELIDWVTWRGGVQDSKDSEFIASSNHDIFVSVLQSLKSVYIINENYITSSGNDFAGLAFVFDATKSYVGYYRSIQTEVNKPDPIPVIPDGCYIVGEATGITELSNSDLSCQMADGINEVTMERRDGMYEKFIYLEAGKEFNFALSKDGTLTKYAASLEQKDLATDSYELENGYWGLLNQSTNSMRVAESGLYHVILDLNLDGNLDMCAGAQVVIAPVAWGVRGYMNGWGYTKYESESNDEGTITWTWKNQELPAGVEFKFSSGYFWKVNLDCAEQVKAHASIGEDMKLGGENIKVDHSGIYDITLTYHLAGGEVSQSFAYEVTKVGDLVYDPATFVVGISGYMNNWNDPSGVTLAKYNAAKTTVTNAATKAGVYVYNMTSVTFAADNQFKFRFNGNWLGLDAVDEVTGVSLVEQDGNIAGVVGTYDIEITVIWNGEQLSSFKADFTPGTPIATTDITVYGVNIPDDWNEVAIYAWNAAGPLCGDWLGTKLTVEDGEVVYEFKNVVPPINVIFNNNGGGAQTIDITNIFEDQEIDISDNLK